MEFSRNQYPLLQQFISRIRTIPVNNEAVFNEKLAALIGEYAVNGAFKDQLNSYVFLVMDHAFFVNAFTDYGIHSSREFFAETYSRLKHKLLPPNLPDNELSHFMVLVFTKQQDVEWLERMNYESWDALVALIDSEGLHNHSEKITHQLHNAIIILCHRLTTIGIDPYLVGKLPDLDDYDSPFFELNRQINLFVKKYLDDKTLDIDFEELRAVLDTLTKVETIFSEIESKKDEIGTSLHLTFLLKRAQQQIERIRLLLNLFITKQHHNKVTAASKLITQLVKAEYRKNSVLGFIKENTNLLAYRIVSHTSEKGEHYIGFSKSENKKLFYSALGGGFVVVFLVFIKNMIHGLHLSLFFEGLLFGLNYGAGFVLMHLLHLTLATKQPSMTASYIAQNIENTGDSSLRPWLVFKQILRSQFVSLIGNLVIVLPLCFMVAWFFAHYMDAPVFDHEHAKAQLYSNHPFHSASLIYACITGVFLSLSGIVIGYFDNKVVFSEIAERIVKHPGLKSYTLESREKLATFVEHNLGGILGNLFLGFCLGMAGNIGKFIGIPFDIRHITISAGNFGISIGSETGWSNTLVITVFAGVLLIGLINIASSFLISFVVACRSRGLSWKQSLRILLGFTSGEK